MRRVSISSTGAILRAICRAEASKALIEGEGVERKGLRGGLCPPHPARGFGERLKHPSGVRAQPRPPANLVHNEDPKTHLVTTFCKYEHASNMYQTGIKSKEYRGKMCCLPCFLHDYWLISIGVSSFVFSCLLSTLFRTSYILRETWKCAARAMMDLFNCCVWHTILHTFLWTDKTMNENRFLAVIFGIFGI